MLFKIFKRPIKGHPQRPFEGLEKAAFKGSALEWAFNGLEKVMRRLVTNFKRSLKGSERLEE